MKIRKVAVILVSGFLTASCMSWGSWQTSRIPDPPVGRNGQNLRFEYRCGNLRFAPAEECQARWRDSAGQVHSNESLLHAIQEILDIAPKTNERRSYFVVSIDPIVVIEGPDEDGWRQGSLWTEFSSTAIWGSFEPTATTFWCSPLACPWQPIRFVGAPTLYNGR